MRKITFILLLFFVGLTAAQELNYTIKLIDANSELSDFGVAYNGENEIVFASSRSLKAVKSSLWGENNQPFLRLFKGVVSEEGEISNIKQYSQLKNAKYHESNVAFSKDGKTVYFSRNNYINKKSKRSNKGINLIQMYKGEIGVNGEWINIVSMPFNNDDYQTGHPVLNKDETKLYFTSDMPGNFGGTDIYVVDVNKNGSYGIPKNLGYKVNTKGKEMFPFVDENDVLYFSSDGYLDGQGGLDIYALNLLDTKNNVGAKNLGFPINSEQDDFSLVFRKGMRQGHFSSNRKGGRGDDDIYSFVESTPIKLECNQVITGIAKHRGTNKLLPGVRVVLYNTNGEILESVKTDESAVFKFDVGCNKGYKIVGSKLDYYDDRAYLTTNDKLDAVLNLELNLAQSEFVKTRGLLMININPIYFDSNESFIREDAAIELEKVVRTMKKYPELKIELGSHTDSRATEEYNWALSERRAKSSVAWLIARGVSAANISGKGYGETNLLIKCSKEIKCSKSEDQLNRRTEFVILNPEIIK